MEKEYDRGPERAVGGLKKIFFIYIRLSVEQTAVFVVE
jgi:hypothetical protein